MKAALGTKLHLMKKYATPSVLLEIGMLPLIMFVFFFECFYQCPDVLCPISDVLLLHFL